MVLFLLLYRSDEGDDVGVSTVKLECAVYMYAYTENRMI